MQVSDFDFVLPEQLIAQEPSPERGTSRLLVLDRSTGEIRHSVFPALPAYLRPGDLLVLNNTRVFPARLIGRRVPSGGTVECLLLGEVASGGNAGAAVDAEWDALVHPGQKLKPGARVAFERDGMTLHGEILERRFFGRRRVRLWADDGSQVRDLIDRIGHIPLPPYIKREDSRSDKERYQTVYARERGSVAAPTAGLHFTRGLLDALASAGVGTVEITLHVGYGTFKPVRGERVEEHMVDPEVFIVSPAAAAAMTRARRQGGRIVAVGTTTTRALESLEVTDEGEILPASRTTSAFLYPGHVFRVVDGLITNFHLPRSSLLMLVAAFAGRERVLAAYRGAVAEGYRFYSYGDGMLIV